MAAEKFDLQSLGHSPFLDAYGGEERKFWMAVLALLAGVVGAMIIGTVAVVILVIGYLIWVSTTGGSLDEVKTLIDNLQNAAFKPNLYQTMTLLIFVAVFNVTFFGGIPLIAGLIRRKPLKAYFTAAPRFRWPLVATGMILFTLLIGPILALDAHFSDIKPSIPLLTLATTTPQRVSFFLVTVISLLFAAMVEELLCRGWLLRTSAAWTRNVIILALLNGFLFSAMHLPDIDPTAFVARMLMGMGFVYMTLRTGGIEFSSGAHAANNILLVLFVQPLPLSPAAPQPFSITSTAFALLAVLGYVLITEVLMAWPALRRWTRADVELQTEPAAAVFS